MSYSPISFDRNLIFRQEFSQGAQGVADNRYAKGIISGGVQIKNGEAKFDGKSGYIDYNFDFDTLLRSSVSVRMKIKFKTVSIQGIFTNAKTLSPGNGLYFSYFSDSNLYRLTYLGVSIPFQNLYFSTQIVKNKYYDVVLTKGTSTNLYVNGILIASNTNATYTNSIGNLLRIGLNATGYFNGNMSLFEIYSRSLSAPEVKSLYQEQLYTFKPSIPLLLDFDSTGGVIIDRTGRNTLIQNNIEIKSIGKIKSVHFPNIGSKVTVKMNSNVKIISFWISSFASLYLTANEYMTYEQTGIPSTLRPSMHGNKLSRAYLNGSQVASLAYTGSTNVFNGVYMRKSIFYHLIMIYESNLNVGDIYFPYGGRKQFVSKLQIFQGNLSSNEQDTFAVQLYNSQKWMFV